MPCYRIAKHPTVAGRYIVRHARAARTAYEMDGSGLAGGSGGSPMRPAAVPEAVPYGLGGPSGVPAGDPQGGVPVPRGAMARARAADLVTLPDGVRGTNCGNCRFGPGPAPRGGRCRHPRVALDVNPRMCCYFWDNPGALRAWK